jgi:hypothetical protein
MGQSCWHWSSRSAKHRRHFSHKHANWEQANHLQFHWRWINYWIKSGLLYRLTRIDINDLCYTEQFVWVCMSEGGIVTRWLEAVALISWVCFLTPSLPSSILTYVMSHDREMISWDSAANRSVSTGSRRWFAVLELRSEVSIGQMQNLNLTLTFNILVTISAQTKNLWKYLSFQQHHSILSNNLKVKVQLQSVKLKEDTKISGLKWIFPS